MSRTIIDEIMWAVVDDAGNIVSDGLRYSRAGASDVAEQFRTNHQHRYKVIRVRVTTEAFRRAKR